MTFFKRYFFNSLIFLIITISSSSAKTLSLSTWTTSPLTKSDRSGYLDKVLIEAFKRVDLSIELIKKPPERSLLDANNGDSDGDYIRVPNLEKVYPNLIKVPSKLFEMEFVVFSKKELNIKDWSSLKPYNVGIPRGWKILEMNVKESKSRHSSNSPESMFKMLDSDRIDIAIYSRHLGRQMLKDLKISVIKDRNPPLAVKEMFLYLNKKHAKIIPALTRAMESMKKDGAFEKRFSQVLKIKTQSVFKKKSD